MSIYVKIRKSYGSFTLKNEFESDGVTLSLLGQSGSGKSMSLKCIAGIIRPDEGRIVLNGRVLFDSEKGINVPVRERRVGYLFQNYALFPNMSVLANVMTGLALRKDLRKPQKRELALGMLGRMGIQDLKDRKISEISGGQAQRVALSRILINEPEILLLDEPFSALDAHLKLKLQNDMGETLKSYGHDAIIVTHDRNEAYALSKRTIILKDGHVVQDKGTKELFKDPGNVPSAVITGCKNIVDAERLSSHEVFVPSWGVKLKSEKEVMDGLKAIGIRAHYFSGDINENRYPVTVTSIVEEPFEWVLSFRYGTQTSGEDVCLRRNKGFGGVPKIDSLGIMPSDVMLLY